LYLTLLTLRFLFLQHKRLLKHAKGYRGRSKNCFTIAIRRVEKAWQYAYRDRKVKKRVWRTLWIQRLSAAARQYNIRYSRLIAGLNYASVPLNRKVLSELAATEPFAFKSVIDVIKYQQAEHDAKKLLSSST
jgi:large subunit ribosomal protein L20